MYISRGAQSFLLQLNREKSTELNLKTAKIDCLIMQFYHNFSGQKNERKA